MSKEKNRFEIVLEIAKRAHELEEEIRNKELYEKKDEPIKKINESKQNRNLSLEAYEEYFSNEKEAGRE